MSKYNQRIAPRVNKRVACVLLYGAIKRGKYVNIYIYVMQISTLL